VAFLLLYDLGLRRVEVCNLRWDEHMEARADGSVWVRPLGNGSKRRKLVCTRRLAEELKAWQGAHGSSPVWVVPNQYGQQMSRNRMSWLATEVLANVGVKGTARELRHTFATKMLRKGVNVRTIQDMLGHGSLATTMRYLGVNEADIEVAILAAWPTAGERASSGTTRDGLRQRREPDAARAHARAMRLLRAGSRWAAYGPPSLLSGLGSAPLAEAWRPTRDDRNPGPVLLPLLLLLRWSSSPRAGSQRFPFDHAAVAQAHLMDRVQVLERLPQLLAARYSS
jgi:Phage integrase family